MDIKIRIKLREETEGENFVLKMPVLDNTKLNNISLKTDSNREFTNRPSNLQGMKLLSFKTTNFDRNQQDQIIKTKSFKFNQNGILCNFDGQEGHLQSENEDNTNEIVFGATNSNGYYQVTMEMSSATGLSSFVIYGDLLANQFPTELTIDGVPFYSDDNKLVIPLDSTQDTHTIVFKKWNRPNYNACITIIRATKEYLTFSNTQIDSLKSIERNNVNASEINYGVLANSGSVELLDADGEIQDLVNDGILPNSNIPVDILVYDAVLQNHISNDSNYETAQKMFNMSLSNKIEMLDKLKYEGFAYPENSLTLYAILKMVMSSLLNDDLNDDTNGKFKTMLNNRCMTPSGEVYIYDYLQNIIVEYPVIEYGYTYRQVLDDICKIAQLNLFIDKNNEYKFISARPLLLSGDFNKMIRITKDTLKEPPSYDLIMKNKYQAVEISEIKSDSVIDYNTIIGKLDDSDLVDKYTNINNGNNEEDSIHLEETGGGSSVLHKHTYASYGYVEDYYTSGSITIDKQDKFNINKIIKFYTGQNSNNENYIKHTINYTKTTKNATRLYSPTGGGWGQLQIDDSSMVSDELSGVISQSKVILYEDSVSWKITVSLTDKTNLGTLSYTLDSDGNYIINYTVLVGKKQIKVEGHSEQAVTVGNYFPDVNTSGTVEEYLPHSLEISFYGDKRVIYFEDTSVSSSNVNTSEVVANFGNTTTKLLQDQTTYNGTKMTDIIKNNILEDYQYGVSNLRLEMFTTDLNYKNGTRAKTLDNGEVLNVGDIAFLTNDKDKNNQQRYWCVYDNQYTYDGSVDESVKFYQKREYYGLYNEQTFLGWHYLISNGDIEIINSDNLNYLIVKNKSLKGKLIVNTNINVISNFIGCTRLTSVILNDNITSISNSAFSGCSSLENIKLSNNITEIKDATFENCFALQSINIPNNITKFGTGAFDGCSNLTNVILENPNGWKVSLSAIMLNAIDISSSDLENTTTAATYLTTTYKNYYWRRYTT